MFKGLGAFLTVESTFLLGGGGATDVFVVGRGAFSAEGREEGVFIFMFEVEVNS